MTLSFSRLASSSPSLDAWRAERIDLAGLDRLAQRVALFVKPGDCLCLEGPLGAGKTSFARLLIGHLGSKDEVQSPSFALLQSYETARFAIHHCDFYRLGAGEAEELGLEDCLADGLLIVEWPGRAPEVLPADRLVVRLEETDDPTLRTVVLMAYGNWQARAARLVALDSFLAANGYGDAALSYLQGDASARSYARLALGTTHAVLMNSPAMADGPPIQGGKPYSRLVHLAETVTPFVAVDAALRARGLAAPEIYAADLEAGFLVLEDLGSRVFAGEIANGASQETLTSAAVEVLLHLAEAPPEPVLPLGSGPGYRLPRFDPQAMLIEAQLLVDWLWPAVHGRPVPDAVREDFIAAWLPLLEAIAGEDTGWVLRDYHSPNLLWLPERVGLARVGVVDFQDALIGPLAYDLVSLLQDARIDVPAALEATLLDQYCARRQDADPGFAPEHFRQSYAVLGAQRNAKILGIFARLAKRDGKRGYLAHMPRVARYLARDLAHPALSDVRRWYDRELPDARALPPASL